MTKQTTFCYIDHSKPVTHPYYSDHMNAHLRTEECEKKERRSMKKRKTVVKSRAQAIAKLERERKRTKHGWVPGPFGISITLLTKLAQEGVVETCCKGHGLTGHVRLAKATREKCALTYLLTP